VRITTALAVYFVLWWIVLFTVLPFGVQSQGERGDVVPGSDPGAPALPRLGLKLLCTTLVSAAIFVLLWLVQAGGLVTLDDLDLFRRRAP
jgi:predicted secreted protein